MTKRVWKDVEVGAQIQADTDESIDYAMMIITRARGETSGPGILATACYIVLKELMISEEKSPDEIRHMFVRMAEGFGHGHDYELRSDKESN